MAEAKRQMERQVVYETRERGMQDRLRLVQELRSARTPRVELRGMRRGFGGSMAQAVAPAGCQCNSPK